jgi:hypothetical protein
MSVTLDDKKTWRGWTLPAAEEHLPDWMQKTGDVRFGRPTYQARKYDSAMAYTRRRRMAIDIGANVGLWSWLMAKDFDQLHAFEPVPLYASAGARTLKAWACTCTSWRWARRLAA